MLAVIEHVQAVCKVGDHSSFDPKMPILVELMRRMTGEALRSSGSGPLALSSSRILGCIASARAKPTIFCTPKGSAPTSSWR
jgi:hypothetical protein